MSQLAAIFDWDGVIIDSSRQHEQSWEVLAREEGRSLPRDHFVQGFGRKNEWIIPNLLHWASDPAQVRRLSLRKEALYRELLVRGGLIVLPGAVAFLDTLAAAAVPCAIGSSTHRENIETCLRLTDLHRYFQAIITSEDVTEGKPHPQVFLLAAGRLGAEPGRCVVFEDAPAGIDAAHRGGMKAVGLTTTHPREHLAQADLVVDRLDTVTLGDLKGLVGEA
jgi:HAD superfamily hydrolase (TIGR01509 family)